MKERVSNKYLIFVRTEICLLVIAVSEQQRVKYFWTLDAGGHF